MFSAGPFYDRIRCMFWSGFLWLSRAGRIDFQLSVPLHIHTSHQGKHFIAARYVSIQARILAI
jgi:hypothetical protein